MKVILFGATGMVGQGVLRECLLDTEVAQVLSIARRASGQSHAKLRDLVVPDLLDYGSVESQLTGFDACFFCLGISSLGMSEADYRRVTFDIALAAAKTLVRLNPTMTFLFVSGAGTDSSEKGRSMWARVKGATENALMRLPFKTAVMFRPALIVPIAGVRSRTRLYRVFYSLVRPLWPILRVVFPGAVTTTERIGRAMLRIAREGSPRPVLESRDINAL